METNLKKKNGKKRLVMTWQSSFCFSGIYRWFFAISAFTRFLFFQISWFWLFFSFLVGKGGTPFYWLYIYIYYYIHAHMPTTTQLPCLSVSLCLTLCLFYLLFCLLASPSVGRSLSGRAYWPPLSTIRFSRPIFVISPPCSLTFPIEATRNSSHTYIPLSHAHTLSLSK